MTQLIINGIVLPETSHDKYKCYAREESEDLRMINGRLVTEVGYSVETIEYSYDYLRAYLSESDVNALMAALRSGAELDVEYLAPDSGELRRGLFKCMKAPIPTFAFSKANKPYWHNYSFTLEEVEPGG